jgi:hypothetical protein
MTRILRAEMHIMTAIIWYSPNISRMIKLRMMIKTGMVIKRNAYRVLVGVEKDDYEGLDLGMRIILKWILKIQNDMLWTGLRWFRICTSCKTFIKV